MNLIESQVCTLGQAQELKLLGVKQDSIFVHRHQKIEFGEPIHTILESGNWSGNLYSAWTSGELGVMLPKRLYIGHKGESWDLEWLASQNLLRYVDHDSDYKQLVEFRVDNEAVARADLLIYLLKNKLVSIDEVNKRLFDG